MNVYSNVKYQRFDCDSSIQSLRAGLIFAGDDKLYAREFICSGLSFGTCMATDNRSRNRTESEPRAVSCVDDWTILAVNDDDAGDVFDALSSSTAREILATVSRRPRTASEIADAVGITAQNVDHHLDQLVDCELLEVLSTDRTNTGRPMAVYSPTSRALLLTTGDPELPAARSNDRRRQLAAVGLVALCGVLLDAAVGERWITGVVTDVPLLGVVPPTWLSFLAGAVVGLWFLGPTVDGVRRFRKRIT